MFYLQNDAGTLVFSLAFYNIVNKDETHVRIICNQNYTKFKFEINPVVVYIDFKF